jgi:hypothetical protein
MTDSEGDGEGNGGDGDGADDKMDWQSNLGGVKTLFDTDDEDASKPDNAGVVPAGSGEGGGGGDNAADKAVLPANGNVVASGPAVVEAAAAEEAATRQGSSSSGQEAREVTAAAVAAEAANLAERVRTELDEQRIRAVAAVRAKMEQKMLAYDAVLEAKRSEMCTPHLLGGVAAGPPAMGTLLSNGDGRMLKVQVEVNLGQRRTTTASFDSVSLKCLCKATHSGVGLANLRGGGGGGERVAILLSDQAYPPTWPASGPHRCVAILRVEFGTLHELALELLRRLKGASWRPAA